MNMQVAANGVGHFEESLVGVPRSPMARIIPAIANVAHDIVVNPYRAEALMNAAPGARDVSPFGVVTPAMQGEFLLMANNYAAPRASSYVGTRQGGGRFTQFDAEDDGSKPAAFIRAANNQFGEIAPGAEYPEVDDKIGFGTYTCLVRGAARVVADQTVANEDVGVNVYARAVRFLLNLGYRDLEQRWWDAIGGTDKWALYGTGDAGNTSTPLTFQAGGRTIKKWSVMGSDPIGNVLDAVNAVLNMSDIKPDTLVLSPRAWRVLLTHPSFVGRVNAGQTAGAAMVTRAAVAALLDIRNVEVSYMSTDKNQFLMGNDAVLLATPPTKSMDEPSAVMRVGWTGFMGENADGTSIRTVRKDDRDADIVQARTAWDIKQQSNVLGVYFSEIV